MHQLNDRIKTVLKVADALVKNLQETNTEKTSEKYESMLWKQRGLPPG